MKALRRLGIILVVLALLAGVLVAPAWADGPEGDVVIMGDNYTLKSGDEIDGDLVVYGGNVNTEEDSQVNGDVTVFGGNLIIAGEVDGDVVVWGGNVTIKADAIVRGDVTSIGGHLTREEGADVRGNETQGWPSVPPKAPIPPKIPEVRIQRPMRMHTGVVSGVSDFFRSLFGMLVMVVLGILVVVFIPRHTETVAEMMVKAPVQSFGSGVATFIVVPIAAIVMCITLCLIPVAALLVLLTGVGLLFGWIAAGLLFGTKLLRALTKKEPNQLAAVAIGLPFLSLLSAVPCIGWLIGLVVITWSLGAVVYSLFGTRAYDQPMPPFLTSVGRKAKSYDPRMDRL